MMGADPVKLAREARIRGGDLAQAILDAAVVPAAAHGASHEDLVKEAVAVGYCGARLLATARGLIGILSKGHPEGAAPFMGIFMKALEEELARDGVKVEILVVEKE